MQAISLPRRRLATAIAAALAVTVVGAGLFTYGHSQAAPEDRARTRRDPANGARQARHKLRPVVRSVTPRTFI